MSTAATQQASSGDATRSDDAADRGQVRDQPAALRGSVMLSTDVMYGLPVPRLRPAIASPAAAAAAAAAAPAPRGPGAAPQRGEGRGKEYCPGELLKKSACFLSGTPDPASMPRLLGICTQAAKGAKTAAAVIAACTKAEGPQPAAAAGAAGQPSPAAYRLEDSVLTPPLGSPGLPTVGSLNHSLGLCKPCAFVFTTGCKNGVQCKFCHLCEQGEKQRRKKERKELKRLGRLPRSGGEPGAAFAVGEVCTPLCPATPSTAASFPCSPDACTAAAHGARRAAAIIAASTAEANSAQGDESSSNCSTADTDDSPTQAAAADCKDEPAHADVVDKDAACGSEAAAVVVQLERAIAATAKSDATQTAVTMHTETLTLNLEEAIAAPKLGSPSLPTVGSAFHELGTCKPCAFAVTERCQTGIECKFCHLCEPGEKNRRKKERKQMRKLAWG